MKIAVVQLGARMHYAVPRIFSEAGILSTLYTDICGTSGLGRLMSHLPHKLMPGGVRRLVARQVSGVPADQVVTFDRLGMAYWWSLRCARTPREIAQAHLQAGQELQEAVIRHGIDGTDAVYSFNSAGLEVMKFARAHHMRTFHEQTIAPVVVQTSLLKAEYARWRGWEIEPPYEEFYRPFEENEKAEWELADTILCGSEFVRQGIAQAGGPVERAVVVPYGVNMTVDPAILDQRSLREPGPLRVLTVGTVGLRKGSPYVMEVARKLQGRADFRMAGPIDLTPDGASKLAEYVTLLGIVPRSEMAAQFSWADVFLLPSICEGSATATYEALAWGLPVVTTPNTGSPVVHDQNGYVVPIRDVERLVDALERLRDQDLRRKMGALAISDSKKLNVSAYGHRLVEAIKS